jgi:predicted short-subunit dehydrogenase-like oxidoreductase (DUF2520 family)
MAAKPLVAIIGPGRLGHILALQLRRGGYIVTEVQGRKPSNAQAKAGGRTALLDARLVWICVPDREITAVAGQIAPLSDWHNKIVFHSSGALSSGALAVLRDRGASVASVHPLMTFVAGSAPALDGVPFGFEGDPAALRAAHRIIRNLGGEPFAIRPQTKALYHAWGMFGSPLLLAALVTAEQVAHTAGISRSQARQKILPLVRQTIANYAALGPARSFSGPMVRGDVAVVRQHLRVLRRVPEARKVYLALADSALRHLPVGNRKDLQKTLRAASNSR